MAALPVFISIAEATHQLGVSKASLRRMINAGTIKAAIIDGETVVSESSVRKFHKQQPISQPTGLRKEDLPEYQKFFQLSGSVIWISDASRKYHITLSALQRWVIKGIVSRIGQDKNKILLNEQDVAYCAEIYHCHRGRGKWVFNSDGTPYILRSEKVQAST